ncbi:MAG: hypothetical protein KGM91_18605 [Burkholderiales bacterium]|nr:hypothetical protein [Burkholderiales bacterium]
MSEPKRAVKPPGRWFARARPDLPDAADLGTSFGLDLSLDPLALEDAAPSPVANRCGRSWVQRLTSRTTVGR